MGKSIISEGKTTNEAIENGLKILKVSKNKVDIKVLENEEKRSFFSILAPRVVKVELTVKEEINTEKKDKEELVIPKARPEKKIIVLSSEEQEKAEKNVKEFLDQIINYLPEGTKYTIQKTETGLNVDINNPNLGYLIGYRGETLYAFQAVLTAIASKGVENKVRVILDIENYKQKREKTLKELAQKVSKSVVKNKKSITLEPMKAYERKIIHAELQGTEHIETYSIGEEPHRKIVIKYKD